MHNEMLQVEGKKMSKSLGNFFTVRDLLDQGYAGEVIRFVLLSTHYSKPMDWTEKKAKEAEATLRKWRALTDGIEADKPHIPVLYALKDDLNTPLAISVLHAISKDVEKSGSGTSGFKASAQMLGLLQDGMGDWTSQMSNERHNELIQELLELRDKAKKNKNYELSDLIRDESATIGVVIKDGPNGAVFEIDHSPAHKAVSTSLRSEGTLIAYPLKEIEDWRIEMLRTIIAKLEALL
jgi:cysteinyl-tRNA synthetase